MADTNPIQSFIKKSTHCISYTDLQFEASLYPLLSLLSYFLPWRVIPVLSRLVDSERVDAVAVHVVIESETGGATVVQSGSGQAEKRIGYVQDEIGYVKLQRII